MLLLYLALTLSKPDVHLLLILSGVKFRERVLRLVELVSTLKLVFKDTEIWPSQH